MLSSILRVRSATKIVTVGYFCLIIALCWAIFGPTSSHAGRFAPPLQTEGWTSSTSTSDEVFIIYRNERGQFACREANKTERERINKRPGGGATRLIYSGASRGKGGLTAERSVNDPTTGLALFPSAGLRIVLHGTTQLEQNQQAKNAFIVAANRWEAVIATPITVVIDVDFGPTFFGQPYGDPDILGATGTSSSVGPYSDLRQRLINGASTPAETELYNALPTTQVPTVQDGGVITNVTNARVARPNARALGIVPDITNPSSIPLNQGDAGIGFNSAFPFDFNPDDGIVSDQTDFDAVATHEIGHALGFVTNSGGVNAGTIVAVWDLFRFRPATATLATFATAPRVMSIGGDQVYFNNQISTFATLELGLSTGGPSGNAGDGRQSSHWRDDSLDSFRPYIGIMDPTIGDGQRKQISENDLRAIDMFGYTLGGPPIVRPLNDNFADAINIPGNSGSLNGTNVWATREAGEPVHANFQGDKSVWYTWQSTINGQITIDTIGSNFDTTLGVYLGSAVNQLNGIAANDDIVGGQNRASRVQFNVSAGTTYRIAVDGWDGEFGNVILNWSASGVTPTPTPTPTPIPSPTPTPSTDFVIDTFEASPDPVGSGQLVSFTVTTHISAGPALNPTISIVLPSGVSFVFCKPQPECTTNGGTVTANFSNVSANNILSLTGDALVTAASGSTLNATATIATSNTDLNPSNNSANRSVSVVELVPFSGALKISSNTEGAHVLVLRGGTVWAWGLNFQGQLGDGTNVNRTKPVQVEDLMFVKDIGAGGNTSIALKTDGTVWTWGSNAFGSLGIGDVAPATSARPVQVTSLSGVTAISAGTGHGMALKSDGTVWTWGSNSRGELGIGVQDFVAHATPVQVPGLTNVVRIVAGDGTAYAIKSDGTVWGWGTTISGKLGDGVQTGEPKTSPIELPALKDTTAIGMGVASTVALKQDGTLWSFGSNFLGRLGRGINSQDNFPFPAQIPDLLGTAVSAGYAHTLVTLPDGTVKAFGGNESGQLGQGSSDIQSHPSPLLVPGLSGVFATAAGTNASFALIGDPITGGTIKAWGLNHFFMLGIQSLISTPVPVNVVENLTVAKPIFSAPAGNLTTTQVFVACGTPGAVIHYTTNGSDPTENDPIVVSGTAVGLDHSLTLKAKAFRAGFTASEVKSAAYIVLASEPLQLLLDESGPALDQIAALDSLLLMRDPFPIVNLGDLLNQGSDRNTRVLMFARNLALSQGETASSVIVNLVDSNSQSFDVPAEQVIALPNTELVQVTFRLPNNLAAGACTIRIRHQLRTSNAGTIRIKP